MLVRSSADAADGGPDVAGTAISAVCAPPGATWAECCNVGLARASGDLTAVLDGGHEVASDWLDLLVRFLEATPDAAAVEGRRVLHDRTSPSADRREGHVEVDAAGLVWTVANDGTERTREVAGLSRHAFLVRRAALADLGPIPVDSRLQTEMAAHDLFSRLLERRWRLYHLGQAEVRAANDRAPACALEPDARHRRDSLLFAWKHLSRRQREHQVAMATRQAGRGLRGLFVPASPAAVAAREALAWMRAHERELAVERIASGVRDGAFAEAVDAAQARARYSFHVRQEILDLVPAAAKVVIDVGCAAGILGAALKRQRPGVQVRGVEISPESAARAREVLDDVYCGSAEDELPGIWPKPDCVVFADVLEHLPDPWQVLRRYREILGVGGTVVVSVPNIGHRSVVEGLLRGRFDYADAGILDRTHLRFFTRASATELLESCGFRVGRVLCNADPPVEAAWLKAANRLFKQSAFLRDLQAVQFVLVATAT